MPSVLLRPFWQQKHPTPTSGAWDFHWHPAGLDGGLLAAVASLDLALGGGAGLVVAPGSVAWVRAFSAEVPSEQRSYVGLAGVVAHVPDAALIPAALAAMVLPPAAPLAGAEPRERRVELAPLAPGPVEAHDHDAALPLARLVVAGGAARVAAPEDPAWPARLGRLLAWLPRVPETLRGVLTSVARPSPPLAGAEENAAHYLARGWTTPEGLAAWRLLARAGRPVAEVFAELGELAAAWETADDLARYLRGVLPAEAIAACDAAAPAPLFAHRGDAGTLWNRVLHYWGRGFLRGVDDALARVLTGRVLVDHLVSLDEGDAELPLRTVRRLRYEALLPAPRAAALLDGLRRGLGT
jgi:hypothetical protein